MNTTVLKRLRALFSNYELTESTKRYYIRQWVKSVRNLGDKWLLAKTFSIHQINH